MVIFQGERSNVYVETTNIINTFVIDGFLENNLRLIIMLCSLQFLVIATNC